MKTKCRFKMAMRIFSCILAITLLFCLTACESDDKDSIPYSHVSAAELTDKQAQEIMAIIVPKQFEKHRGRFCVLIEFSYNSKTNTRQPAYLSY